MLRVLGPLVLATTLTSSCGARSDLRHRDVPDPIGPLGLSLTVETLFQDCDVAAGEDGVEFSGTLRTSIALAESGALAAGDAEVVGEDGTFLARFQLEPFSLHAPDHAATIVKRAGTSSPRGGCQLCSMPVRVRVAVRSVNPITPVQQVESELFGARCTR